MQIQIGVTDAKNVTHLAINDYKMGQSAVVHTVQAGQKITLIVDGVTLTGVQPVGSHRLKLIKVGQDLVVEVIESSERLVELTNFYVEEDVTLFGDHWTWADGSQLQQLSEGVRVAMDEPMIVPVAIGVLSTGVVDALGGSLIATSLGGLSLVAAERLNKSNSLELNSRRPSGLGAVVATEATNGINAAEAVSDGGVPVQVTLPTDAVAGDVITVSVAGGTPVSYTVTTADIALGTVSVLLSTAAIAAAGQGAVDITTSYADVAGNPAAGGSVITHINIDTQGPGTPMVTVPAAAGGGINALEAAGGVSLVVSLPAGAAAGDTIMVSVDGGTPVSYTVTANDLSATLNPAGTVSVLLSAAAIAAAGEGAAVITTHYADAAGNPAAVGAVTNNVDIDIQPPSAAVINTLTTNDTTPTITGTATLLAGETLSVVVNGATYSDVTVTAGHWSIDTGTSTHTGTLGVFANGQSYNVTATVTDAAGNSSSDTSSNEISIDTQAPSKPAVVLHQDTANGTDFVTSNGTLDVTGLEVGATWQYSLDGGTHWQAGNGGNPATAATGSFVAAHGSYASGQVQVRQTDAAGNISDIAVLVHPLGIAVPIQLDGLGGSGQDPKITAMADGGYVVTWMKTSADGSARDVFVQRFGHDNIAQGLPHQLDALGGLDQQPHITELSDGGYLVTWTGTSSDWTFTGIFSQHYGSDDVAHGSPRQLVGLGGSDQVPQIAAMSDGGYVLTWSTSNADWSVRDILVQRYGSDDVAQGSPHQLDGLGGLDQVPQITAMADGGYVVTWFGYSADWSVLDVFVQRYGSDNTALGTPHQLNGLGGQNQDPQITAMADGGYVVTWTGANATGSVSDVFVQRFGSDNTAQGSPHQLDGLGGLEQAPQITALADGGYVVTWTGYSAGWSAMDVFVQRFDADNNLLGAPSLPLVVDTDFPTAPIVDVLSTNHPTPTITGTATLLADEHLTVMVNGATYSDVTVTAGHWSIDTGTATHTGTLGILANGQSYNVTATVTDAAGNSSTDASSNEITFDNQAPTLTSSTPGDGVVRVRADHDLTFTFNEDIAVGTGHITLADLTDNTNIQIDVTDHNQVSVHGAVLTLNPTNNLGYGDNYELRIDAGAIHDLAGNSFAGITNTNPLDFKTSLAGQAVISSAEMGGLPFAYLGYASAQLIAPVMVEDKIYYALDLNQDNVQNSLDDMHLDDLSKAFFGVTDGTQFTDSHRTWTVNDYFNALLPTVGASTSGQTINFTGTNWSTNIVGWDFDPNSNPIYNDSLAIWDAYNGTSTSSNIRGWPPSWSANINGTLTSTPDISHIGYYYSISRLGSVASDSTGSTYSVVLQVL